MGADIANSTVPDGSTEGWKDRKRYLWLIGLVVPSLAFIGCGMQHADRLGGVVLDRPDRHPRHRPGDRPDRRPRPLQPARRRDRGAGAGPLLPLDHLPLPAHPVRRLRRRVLADRRRRRPRLALRASSGWPSRSAASAASASTPPTSSATSARATSAGCPRSRWRQSFYGHFYIEHNRGHHVRVATPEDPAQLAGRRELLPVLAAHGLGLAEAAPGGSRSAATPARSSTRSGSATTCSTPG